MVYQNMVQSLWKMNEGTANFGTPQEGYQNQIMLDDNESALELILEYHKNWYAYQACKGRTVSYFVTLFLNIRRYFQRQAVQHNFFDILFGIKNWARKAIKDCFILGIWQGNLMSNLIPNIWITRKAQILTRVLNFIVDLYSQKGSEIQLETFLRYFVPDTPILHYSMKLLILKYSEHQDINLFYHYF